jgi:hypothetical protein
VIGRATDSDVVAVWEHDCFGQPRRVSARLDQVGDEYEAAFVARSVALAGCDESL